MHATIIDLLVELLDALAIDDARRRAHALLSYLLGTVVQQTVRPVPFNALRPEVAAVAGLAA